MTKDFDARVSSFTFKKGCPNKYIGYRYMTDSVCTILEQDTAGSVKKMIYDNIAAKHNTDAANVERCIRTLTESWWKRARCGGLFQEKPTNRELLCTIAEIIRIDYMRDRHRAEVRRRRREEKRRAQERGSNSANDTSAISA